MNITIGKRRHSPSFNEHIRKHFFHLPLKNDQAVVAIAGNPNVGKSTLFNALTGLRQHTGNWPGKTVDRAQGAFLFREKSFLLVDLPGTYSLLAHSAEEEIARDFICFGQPDAMLVILDATALERSLNLALQIMEITSRMVVCVNLMDEAGKKGITVNIPLLEKDLGVPVIPTTARNGKGLKEVQTALYEIAVQQRPTAPKQVRYSAEIEGLIQELLPRLQTLPAASFFNSKWLALRLLDSHPPFVENISRFVRLQNAPTATYQEVEKLHAYRLE
ncbi:MAG: 50S ribosome-binding GTPase [Peptococcaceae bacterium]|jgi:ferrous iron transport protein B|nr:50S ribosome-binding GTPase [Peptococcaceae bacterium]